MSLQPGHHEGRRVLPGGVSPASFVVMTGVGVFFAILPVVVKAPWWQGILAVLLDVGLFTVVTARETKGLEFDEVVLVETTHASFGDNAQARHAPTCCG